MIQIGIDTSVLIGLLDPKDIWHQQAMALKQALIAHDADILCSTVSWRKRSVPWPGASTNNAGTMTWIGYWDA